MRSGAACWRYLAESVSLLTFLGLHAESDDRSAPCQPTLCSEIRRRAAAHLFILDKDVALFTGRPPLLSRRYASTTPPLDLRDEDLMAGHQEVARAMQFIDANGWNTEGHLYAATSLRTRLMIASIREELIEITSGNWTAGSLEILL